MIKLVILKGQTDVPVRRIFSTNANRPLSILVTDNKDAQTESLCQSPVFSLSALIYT